MIGYNLFAKVQEVYTYPSGSNPQMVIYGKISNSCPVYNSGSADSIFITADNSNITADNN